MLNAPSQIVTHSCPASTALVFAISFTTRCPGVFRPVCHRLFPCVFAVVPRPCVLVRMWFSGHAVASKHSQDTTALARCARSLVSASVELEAHGLSARFFNQIRTQ